MRLHFENNIFVVTRSPRALPFAFQKETKQKKKNGTKKQKTAPPGVEPSYSARSSNSLTTLPQ